MARSKRSRARQRKELAGAQEATAAGGLPATRDEGVRFLCAYICSVASQLVAALYPGAPFQRKVRLHSRCSHHSHWWAGLAS